MATAVTRAWTFVVGGIARLRAAGVGCTAAALSFTSVLGLVPLFTVAFVYVARYPLFQQWLDALERFLLKHLLPGSGSVVRGYLTDFTAKAANLQGVSIAFVVITAVLLVATVEREINAIWGARGAVAAAVRLRARHRRRAAAHRRGCLLDHLGDRGVGGAAALTSHALPYVAPAVAVAIMALAFTLLYALMPSCRVPLRLAAIGGLFAALGFEVAKQLFGLFIARVPTYQLVYGALAALPLFLLWVYVSWVVVLAGAAATATLAEGPLRRPRGARR